MARPGRPKVTWKTIEEDPEYGKIWKLLGSGPKTFSQLRRGLAPPSENPTVPSFKKFRPSTLLKRLRRLERAGLVELERRKSVLRRMERAKLYEPDQPGGRGRLSVGAWLADPSYRPAIDAAVEHARLLTGAAKERLTLERIGNGVDLVVAGALADKARWWYPGSPSGELGRNFNQIDESVRELGRRLLAMDPDAVRAQHRFRSVVKRYGWKADETTERRRNPRVEEALEKASKHTLLLSVRVLPAYWLDDSGLPVKLR